MMTLEIRRADLEDRQVRALIGSHHAHAHAETPPENIYALEAEALRAPDLELYAAWDAGVLLGLGALRQIGDGAGEIKSLHVAAAARGRGVARALMVHLEARALAMGVRQLWLETGAAAGYAASRALYRAVGFQLCSAFGDYPEHPNSVFMTKALRAEGSDNADRQLSDQSGCV